MGPDDTCRFCQRACRIAHVSLRVAAREYGAPFAVVVQPKWRRTRTQTAKKFGESHSRFGTLEPGSRGPRSSGNRPKHADVASRFLSQNGDPDRQCRSQSTFESVQPPLRLTGDLTIRVPGRDGLKGVRVGEASNPGPPRLLPRTSVASTQADSVDEELMTQLEADLSGENRRPKVHVLSEGSSGSDTESRPTGQVRRGTRRRLRLRWTSFATEHASLHREARIVDAFVRDLARRVGAVPRGGQLPRVLQHQRWSPLNVPLLWCAAGAEDTTPVLDWLAACAETMDEEVDFFEGRVNPADAVRVAWTALRAALRSWGASGQEDLTQWLRDQRFAGAQPGNHIPARAQEFLISEACRFDARVALLEAFFVRLTLHMGRQMAVPPQVVEADRWDQLDSVNLTEFMLLRVPMLKSCPHFLRGQMRECWGTALLERTERNCQAISRPNREHGSCSVLCQL